MKIAVMGAGAVGCYYGAMLARAGHAVTLIGRPQHVERVKAEGLLLEMATFRGRVALEASVEASGVRQADIILFCVKSTDTEAAGREMLPFLGADTLILCLQNGVDNADRLAAVLGRPVVPAAVYVAADMGGPGHVRHHGRGELVLGPFAGSAATAAQFTAAAIPTTISDDVDAALWAKLAINCAYNALSAATQQTYGQIIAVPGVVDVMADVVGECVAVARASGIVLAPDILDTVLALAKAMPNQYSSTAQDVARGKPSEVDFLNGLVVRKGAQLGIPTPANRALQVMVKLVEAKPR